MFKQAGAGTKGWVPPSPDLSVQITRKDLAFMIKNMDPASIREGYAAHALLEAQSRFFRAVFLMYPEFRVKRLGVFAIINKVPFHEQFEVWMEIQKAGGRQKLADARGWAKALNAARGFRGASADTHLMGEVFRRIINESLDEDIRSFIVDPVRTYLGQVGQQEWQRALPRRPGRRRARARVVAEDPFLVDDDCRALIGAPPQSDDELPLSMQGDSYSPLVHLAPSYPSPDYLQYGTLPDIYPSPWQSHSIPELSAPERRTFLPG